MNLQTLQPGEMVQLMQGRPMQLVTVAINLLLVVWIAWMLANVTLDLLETGEPVAEPVTVEAPPAPQPQTPAPSAASPPPPQPWSAHPSRRQYRLP